MATITSIAEEYGMTPDGLRTFAGLDAVFLWYELDATQEAFLRDLLDNTKDGVYVAPITVMPACPVCGSTYRHDSCAEVLAEKRRAGEGI